MAKISEIKVKIHQWQSNNLSHSVDDYAAFTPNKLNPMNVRLYLHMYLLAFSAHLFLISLLEPIFLWNSAPN